jgi:hypothetical protein
MALFGSFETEREVYSDPIYTVYSAKKSGDAKSEYAVKVFSIQRVEFDPETTSDLAPLLLDIESARLQCIELQARGAAASKFIAPVFEKGQDDRGVWYATRFYPRSVNKIILGKVALTRDAIQHLIGAIAQGALDFKRNCSRSHGDIRPSNIQISRSQKLSEAEVVLCDPMPGGEEEAVSFEVSDLRSIGRILLQLVQQRAITNEDDFLILPILSTVQWTSLFGKDTETWLNLCNRLLDPNLSLEEMTLDRLVTELQQLQPKANVSPRVMIAGAVGLVCLAAIVLVALRPRSLVIEVTSDPPGAAVLVNKQGQPQVTPMKLKLKKGSYAIEAQHTQLRLQGLSTNLLIPAGGPTKLHFQFAYGSVIIKSEPAGATIRTEGAAIGKTPSDSTGYIIPVVPAGTEVAYDLVLDDHATRTVRGVVTNGQKLVLSETLPLSKDVGTIDMDSTPRGAKVFWRDKVLVSATPDRTQLEQGTYALRARYKDWPEKQLTVEVKSGTTVPASFYFENGLVSLDSDPPGATVWIGTNNLGSTPMSLRRPIGETSFRFELTGFESTNVVVRVADKSRPNVRPMLVSDNGVFELSSDPPAALILDSKGIEVGRTSSGQALKLSRVPGNYSFTARIDGLGDVGAALTVNKREIKKHTFVFDYGSVSITSEPDAAAVSTDGKALGFTPATFIQKPGAKVAYRIAAPDYIPQTSVVTVATRELNRPVMAKLLPEPVSVRLTSDPPGAQFYFGQGSLTGTDSVYQMPWGTNVVTARNALYPWLAEVTEQVVLRKGAPNAADFKFSYGSVSFETTPTDANAAIFDRGQLIAHTPTNLYVRPGRVDYEIVCEDQTNRVGTNVVLYAMHRFASAFEIKRDYTNTVGMVLVRVKDPLYVCKFEVTQEQYQRVMGRGLEGKPRQPVVNVKWADAQEFCQKLSQLDAAAEWAKRAHVDSWTYGLPTQTEWSRFSQNDPAQLLEAVFDSTLSEPKEIDPLRKSANRSGLYDLYGNVAEWCVGADKQPITIGGSFYNRKPRQIPADWMIETKNLASPVAEGSPNIGFRCVLRPPGQ